MPRSDAGEDPWTELPYAEDPHLRLRLRSWPAGTMSAERRARYREEHELEVPRDAAWWDVTWKGGVVDHPGAAEDALQRLLTDREDPMVEAVDGKVPAPWIVTAAARAPSRLLFELVAAVAHRAAEHPQLQVRACGRAVPVIHVLTADQTPALDDDAPATVPAVPLGATPEEIAALLDGRDPHATPVGLAWTRGTTVQELVDTWSAVRARGFERCLLDTRSLPE